MTNHGDPLGAIHAHLSAFNTGDLDGVVATFADDAVLTSAGQMVVGRRALRSLFADAFAAPVSATLELRHAVVQGDEVACELTERLRVGEAEHEVDVAAFYSVRLGRLARVRIYRDLPDEDGHRGGEESR